MKPLRDSLSLLIAAGTLVAALGLASAPSPQAAEPAGTKPDSASAKGDSAGAKPEWKVANPPGPRDDVEFDTSEGAWISVDVHPQGKLLVFDLLGDIYTVPIEGGDAKLVSGGIPYEIQPRFSPDGKRILFTSDRGGGDNAWVMNLDGSEATQVTKEKYRLVNNGVWHPSGEYIVAKKHFTWTRSLGAGEMWMYRIPQGGITDGGDGVQLTKKKNDQQDVGEPEMAPDGKYLYWSEDMSPGPSFQYNKDPNGTIYMIRRLELATGEVRDLLDVAGGAVRPQASPDGKTLAFVRRVRTKSELCLLDLESREIRAVWDGLDEDQQETWSLFGVFPGFDWTPDGRSIVISGQGKLWRVEVASGKATPIPFRVHVKTSVALALRFPQHTGEAQFPVRVIRWPQVAADGSTIVQALGSLYRIERNDSKPKLLLKGQDEIQAAPRLSWDRKKIVFVTWNDLEGGRVKTCDVHGGGERIVVKRPGHYTNAAFSPDGKSIVVERSGRDSYRGRMWEEEPGIYLVDAEGKDELRLVTREGTNPLFSRDGKRIYLQAREGSAKDEKAALISVNLLGSERRLHATSARAVDFVPSPDEKYLAFEELWDTYVTPFPMSAATIEIAPEMKNLPVRKLSKGGGTYLSWSPDSREIHWSLGPDFFSAKIEELFAKKDSAQAKADSAKAKSFQGLASSKRALGWKEKADIPATDVVFTGATVLPMDDLSVIHDAVVHVKGNKIVAVGPRGQVDIPKNAKVYDVTGKTLMPGLVDVHAHTGSSGGGVHSQQSWAFLANLAFGVTTTHDPSNNSQMIFAYSEMVKKGMVVGPRIFSTGTILYGAEGDFKTVIDKLDDAIDAVHRTTAWGAFSVKSYNQPRRDQRQMIIEAARQAGIMVVPEGGSTLHSNITHLIDGHTTIEHSIPVAPLYDPELRLLSRFGTGYTPTLIVGYGGIWGENYWYAHTDVWKNERLMQFVPRTVVDPRARRREMAPEEEYHHFALAKTAAEVVHRGGNVQLGAHGQLQGLGAHWELWMFAQGGMTNHEALRAATWMGARAIGLDGDLGSIREGKLADLIVIDGDPLQDLQLSQDIDYTMINGRLYDARTMAQLEPEKRPPPKLPNAEGVAASATCACSGDAAH